MPSFSAFDSRNYRTVAPRDGYDRWARTYEETVEDAMDIVLLDRVELDWKAVGSVADLGCGTGRTGAWWERFRGHPISFAFVWERA
jgi:SAM-dependent methyltransferase